MPVLRFTVALVAAARRAGARVAARPVARRLTAAFSQPVQLLVGSLLLFEIGVEQAYHVVVAKLSRPGDQRAVAGDLIMLDGLRAADDGGVKHVLVIDFAGDFVGFLDQTVDGRTIHASRRLAQPLEHLIEPRDLVLSLAQMRPQARR